MRKCAPSLVLVLAILVSHGTAAAAEAADLPKLIDQRIEARLAAEALRPANLADDAEFCRRVYLDLHGVVPTFEQSSRFLADTAADKRTRLVDDLLASPRYGYYMADMWQRYLMSPLADDRRVREDRFRDWLAGQFNTATWDRIATSLLTATGKMEDNAAVTYIIEGRLPRSVPDLTDITSRFLLGVRLNCAQCHDHPFVNVKQQEFWGMAAFFTQVQTPKRAKQVYEKGVIDDPTLTLANLKDAGAPDGFVMQKPTFLGGGEMPAGKTNRAALADWMTSPGNPYFARAMVNRTWWRLFGRGIVNPVDDMHSANPPSHPELLDLLTKQFVESGFDLKALTRSIVLSNAYQRTSRPGDAPDKQAELFGRMSIKVMSAGQLHDSMAAVFGPPTRVTGIDVRGGARHEFVEFFGDSGDPNPTDYRRGIPHLLRQMNSGQFGGANIDALVARLTSPGRTADEVTGDLFQAILARRPTVDELARVRAYIDQSGSTSTAYREVAWVLMMTSEFSVNR